MTKPTIQRFRIRTVDAEADVTEDGRPRGKDTILEAIDQDGNVYGVKWYGCRFECTGRREVNKATILVEAELETSLQALDVTIESLADRSKKAL